VGIPNFQYVTSLALAYNGDCTLLGVGADLTLYVEEIYGDEGWIAQRALRLDGTVQDAVDEDLGRNRSVKPLALPDDLTKPQTGWHTMNLNFAGARHRGLRSLERTGELVRPLTIQDRMALTEHLDIGSPTLIGMAESYVLAEAALVYPMIFLVCRRLRIAFALEEEQVDEQNQPYDYDTTVLYAAHRYDRGDDRLPRLSEILTDLPGVQLHRPMDCLIVQDYAFVADGGAGERNSAVHVWRVVREEEG
jgi:hypothetical protein